MVKQIVSVANGRPGMRLCTLMKVVRLARKFGFDYGINWPKYFDFEINNYANIFSSEFIEKRFMSEVPSKLCSRPVLRGLTLSNRDIETIQSGAAGNVFTSPLPLLLVGEEVADVEPLFPECFTDLDCAAAVRDMIAAAREAMAGSAFIALHVRRGDLLSDLHRDNDWAKKKHVPVTVYETYVAARAESNCFLIFSDSPHVIEEMAVRFPHVPSADSVVPAGGLTDLQVALRDIVLISLSKNAVAAAVSNPGAVGVIIGLDSVRRRDCHRRQAIDRAASNAVRSFRPCRRCSLAVILCYKLGGNIYYYTCTLGERDRVPDVASALWRGTRIDSTNISGLNTWAWAVRAAKAFDWVSDAIATAAGKGKPHFVSADYSFCARSTSFDIANLSTEGRGATDMTTRANPIVERTETYATSCSWHFAIAHLPRRRRICGVDRDVQDGIAAKKTGAPA